MTTPIFHSYGKWYLSGVNTWTVNLIRAMRETEFDSKVLFTGIPRTPLSELDELGIPYDFLDVPPTRKRRQEWQSLKVFLESRAPCIYITNFDFHRSCAVGTLSSEVRVVTVVHSDEEYYYDELRRIGRNCDAIVCVSSDLTAKVKERFEHLADRVHFIPYGIPIPNGAIPQRPTDGPLRLCYCNRLQQYQKRVFDLPVIAAELERIGVDYELDIAGDGRDAVELRRRFDNANLKSPVRFLGQITNTAVMDLCRRSHLFLLTSDFEGLPISLLEAMSVGCVPVVYQIESGIADVIASDEFGRRIPHGETSLLAEAVKNLNEDREKLAYVSRKAAGRVNADFSLNQMGAAYENHFRKIISSCRCLDAQRTGSVRIPFDLSFLGKIRNKWQSMLKTLTHSNRQESRENTL